MIKAEKLRWNASSQRFTVGTRETHCGDCIGLWIKGAWRDTRFEFGSQGWYFVINDRIQGADGWIGAKAKPIL